MSDHPPVKVPTPATTLEQQIMDSNFPKSEREWWAQGEIERLRSAIEAIERIAFVTIDQYKDAGSVADIRRPSERLTEAMAPCNNCGNPLEMCLCDALAAEYERGKKHGLDDRKMIERHNQEQGREITALKIEVSQLKMQLYDLRFGAKKTS